MAAHPVQMQIAKLIAPYCEKSAKEVAEVIHGLAWNMVCVLNAAGMEQSDMMDCISKAVNRATLALAKLRKERL